MAGPSPRSKFNMPFVERRLDDPTGPDKQFKVDSMQYLLSKGITDENLLAKIMLESGWLNKPSGTFNYFGIKEKDKTKGKLVQTTEGLKAYTHANKGKGKRLRSDEAGIEDLRKEIATRGGSIVYENGAVAYDNEGKIKIIDRFKNYNNIEEAFDNFKRTNAKIIADPSKIYATDPKYAEKNAKMLTDIKYYLRHYSSSFGIPTPGKIYDPKDNHANAIDSTNPDYDPRLDALKMDEANPFYREEKQIQLTKEQMRNSLASNAYGSIMFQEFFPDNYDVGVDFGLEDKDSVFDFRTKTTVDSTGEITGPIDYELSGQKGGINLYGGQRQGEKYFGGGIKKEISPGVNLEGSFEKEGDLKQGNIKLKVDL